MSEDARPEDTSSVESQGRRRRRRSRSRTRRVADGVGLGALGLALFVPAICLGGQHVWVIVVGAILSLVAAVLLGAKVERAPALALVVFGLTAYTLFQLLPLPLGLVRLISPASAEIWVDAVRPYGEPAPSWVTLSVDPGATAVEVLKGSAYLCLVLATFGAVAVWGQTAVSALLFSSALLVAAITLLHGALDVQKIFGLFTPPNLADRWTRGPFVNGNNLSGYLNLGALVGCGLWASGRGGVFRFAPAFGVPVLLMTVLLSGSRGGVLSLTVAGLAFGFLMVRFWGVRPVIALGGTILVFGIALAGFAALAGEQLVRSLLDSGNAGKVLGWRWSLGLIREFPVFGVGRGAFETAFPPHRGSFAYDWSPVFTHAENIVVDWTAEWGIPAVLAIAVIATAALPRVVRRVRRDPHLAGIWLGVGALLLQSMVDFGLELFAIGSAFVVALSAGSASSARGETALGRVRFVPAVATALSLIVVLVYGARPVHFDREHVQRAAQRIDVRDRGAVRGLESEIRKLTLRHPGEPYFPLMAAYLAERTGRDAMPWLSRSVARGPRYGRVHLQLADVLMARKRRGQALMHLRLAARYDVNLQGQAFMRAVAWARSVDELARAFPEGSEGGELFRKLCSRVPPARQVECLREALRREPTRSEVGKDLVDGLLTALEGGGAPCDPPRAAECRLEVERILKNLGSALPGYRTAYFRARLMAVLGDRKGAATLLVAECPVSREASDCLERAVDLAAQAGDNALFERAADRRLSLLCTAPEVCAEAHARVAESLGERGAWSSAMRHYLKAGELDPSSARFLAVTEAALKAELPAAARNALARAKRLSTGSPEEARRLREVEALVAEGSRL